MKGVIVAAGYGSRFLPVTRVVPKELLPIVDRPALDWIVQEMVDAGVRDILVISSRRKRAIEDWFDRDPELEAALAHKPAMLERIAPPDVRVQVVRQQEMRGTGHALLLARTFAGEDPVVVAFPDDLFTGGNCTAELVALHERTGCSVLAAAEIDGDVSRYGVLETVERADGALGVRRIVEKPAPGEEPSRLVSYGRYLYTPAIFAELARGLEAHGEGEFFPADAIGALGERGEVVAAVVRSVRRDTGQPLDYLQTVVDLALEHPEVGAPFAAWLRERARDL
ncbi:MAG: UTP--glucose-1-phosphate uridylyltransferase [Alphaproteobacteria bacterium]|nr:UTP--glucose-1-phosphate uridylyltransferase [Alphaproteobacteria bacterium]